MKTLLNCIEEIPDKLRKVYFHKEDIYKNVKSYIGDRNIKKILIVASGTSYNAAFTTKIFGEKLLGIQIELMYPNDFYSFYNKELLNEETLYVFISQSGKTKLVYNSVELVKNKGLLNISITEDVESPIAKASSMTIDMKTDIETYVFRTIGYSNTYASMIFLYLGIMLNKDLLSKDEVDYYLKDYMKAVNNIEKIMEITTDWYNLNKETVLKYDKYIISGGADLYPVAMEAAIKLMEMVPIFTSSFEIEELIHGPQNVFDDSIGYFLISKEGLDSDKTLKISDFVSNEIGKNAIVIGDVTRRDFDISVEYKSDNFYPLEIVTVFQVLSYRIATDNNRDLHERINSNLNNYVAKSLD